MPCYDPRDDEPRVVYQENTAKADRLTQMLCRIYTVLKEDGQENLIPEQDRKWWADHQEFDRQRREKERQSLIRQREALMRSVEALDAQIKSVK